MRIARARVEFDGRPITLGGESPRTSVVVRIGAAAPGSPTTLLEDRLRLLVEARAWRRVNDENVADLARETADRCIDEATREVQADQSCVLQRTAAHTATEIPYCI